MRQNKFFSALMVLCIIAFFTTSWMSPTPAHNRSPVTITAPFIDVGTYPIFPGTFTISGAFKASGTATMDANFNANFTRAHCIIR